MITVVELDTLRKISSIFANSEAFSPYRLPLYIIMAISLKAVWKMLGAI